MEPGQNRTDNEDNATNKGSIEITKRMTNHVGWQVLKSVITVVKMILFKSPFDLKIRRGTCCIRGCTLIMISGRYFMSPLATSLGDDVELEQSHEIEQLKRTRMLNQQPIFKLFR